MKCVIENTELSSHEGTRCQFNGSTGAIKLGIDVHQDIYTVVTQEGGSNPKPPQRFRKEAFLHWAKSVSARRVAVSSTEWLDLSTTIIEAPRLSQRLRAQVTIASETFQLTGSFKFRAAYNVALNVPNWPIIRDHAAGIIEVPEENIREGLRLLYSLANLKVEPTGALTIGAVLTSPEKVCCIVSGGNVDAALYRDCLS
jgi:hypothetical protein